MMIIPHPIMAQKYMLIPLPQGLFEGYDLTTRAVIGALYDRIRLSNYNVIGDPHNSPWYDQQEQRVFCVFSHDELGRQLGVSEKTVRRSLKLLEADGLIWWRKAAYKAANRYFLHESITQELRKQ
ncbi:MAG: HTH domain-containing protein [Clostridia bacterium]|nr:HTH domain-containing protein [Clostridia bacterium]